MSIVAEKSCLVGNIGGTNARFAPALRGAAAALAD
jgi:glucokinase